MTKIFLAASMNFYEELVRIESELKNNGFEVEIPVSAKTMKAKNDFDVTHFKGVFTPQQKGEFIQENFENIASCDAILVINNEKNGIEGYIGANVLMEIGLAFYLKKKIYIWNQYPEDAPYKEELLAFNVEVINQNLNKINV
jgi:nucleoside 2-deoxyribosyltransferase